MNRLTWVRGKYSCTYGYLGKFPFVTISYNRGFQLSTSVPLNLKDHKYDSEDQAKAAAEKFATQFLDFIGAQWKDES